MREIDYYSIQDVEDAVKEHYQRLTEKKETSLRPKAYLLGGQPGSGKSTIQYLIEERDPNVITINGDALRSSHPNYEEIFQTFGDEAPNHTQAFANEVSGRLTEILSDEGYNLIIEGTCRTSEVPLRTCRMLKDKGYEVELSMMCTDKYTAWQSTIDRYNEMKSSGMIPRAVPREKYDETVQALPHNLYLLYGSEEFDEITLYNRRCDCLYRMTETPHTDPSLWFRQILNAHELHYIGKEYAYSFGVETTDGCRYDGSLEEAIDTFETCLSENYDYVSLYLLFDRLDGSDGEGHRGSLDFNSKKIHLATHDVDMGLYGYEYEDISYFDMNDEEHLSTLNRHKDLANETAIWHNALGVIRSHHDEYLEYIETGDSQYRGRY